MAALRGVGMEDVQAVLDALRRLRPELGKRYPTREMGVFRSWVRGEQAEGADIDVVDRSDARTRVGSVGECPRD